MNHNPPLRQRLRTPIGQAKLLLLIVAGFVGCRPAPTTPTPPPTITLTPLVGVDFVTNAPPTAPIVQITPSPLPTSTPLPTPTAVIYTVAEGDTVWDIAYLHNTTPNELITLNPNFNPDFLVVGQTLQLPPPATPIFTALAGTPVPLRLHVTQLQLYQTPVESYWVLGEVQNESEWGVRGVQIEVGLRDEAGGEVTTVMAWTTPRDLGAGESAVFAQLLPQLSAEPHSLAASVVAGTVILEPLAGDGVRIIEEQAVFGTVLTLTGQLSNEAESEVAGVMILGVAYRESGELVGFQLRESAEPLPAGASRPFTLQIAPVGGPAERYRLFVAPLQR